MNVVLISTYELGHQPFGLASPAAWLRAQGASVVCLDLSRESLREDVIRAADFIAFYLPMHTATRLAARLIEPIRGLNPRAHLAVYGLYAPVNAEYFRTLGVQTIIGGEFEQELTRAVEEAAVHCGSQLQLRHETGLDSGVGGEFEQKLVHSVNGVILSGAKNLSGGDGIVSLDRLRFIVPDRSSLPPLKRYAHVILPDGTFRTTGYTEASRGCKHLCRHCPIVPVYNGAFRIVQREVVLADIRQQVEAGAEHITFGDPDFFNGPTHAIAIVEALHREFPLVSYDVTIKIEHLLTHADLLPKLRDTGCLFVTSAVESVDDQILERLDKGHTRADFVKTIALFQEIGLALQPTFVPFTPWTTLEGYRDLLEVIAGQELIENVAPIQLGIRLLIPADSRLLELTEVREAVNQFDASGLLYPWQHVDSRVDALAQAVQIIADSADKSRQNRAETFAQIWRATAKAAGASANDLHWHMPSLKAGRPIGRISEPWYCCAEPTLDQFAAIGAAPNPLPRATLGSNAEGFL